MGDFIVEYQTRLGLAVPEADDAGGGAYDVDEILFGDARGDYFVARKLADEPAIKVIRWKLLAAMKVQRMQMERTRLELENDALAGD